jgi:hypothetical protein
VDLGSLVDENDEAVDFGLLTNNGNDLEKSGYKSNQLYYNHYHGHHGHHHHHHPHHHQMLSSNQDLLSSYNNNNNNPNDVSSFKIKIITCVLQLVVQLVLELLIIY